MSKCGACSRRARKLQRAMVLTGAGRMRASRVCPACARLGWLLVLGADAPDTSATVGRKAKRARAVGVLAAHALAAFDGESR